MRTLLNDYILVRHGFSEANNVKLICSDPEVGKEKYDLTELGRQQAEATAAALAEHVRTSVPAGTPVQMYSSPFLRTRTTSRIIHDSAFPDSPPVVFDDRLCERFFGMWDGKDDTNYAHVWEEDAADNLGTLNSWGCESTDEVASRAWSLVEDLEREAASGDTQAGDSGSDSAAGLAAPRNVCVLVAHGDVLQILQTRFLGVPSNTHRSLQHMETAGWREMPRLVGTGKAPQKELVGR
ncbi:histidine phosphatase superfamily [Hyaloraphidium curvatum]|nr:histidine phosphatase superfamily [Hyaloraphidium curvatum]